MLDRRALIRLLTKATGLHFLAAGSVCARTLLGRQDRSLGSSSDDPPLAAGLDLEAALDAYFPHMARERVREIGPVCVQELGAAESRLRGQLLETVALYASDPTREEALRALEEAVEADFESLRIRSVRGWQLAETEVRLCALAELVGRRRRLRSQVPPGAEDP